MDKFGGEPGSDKYCDAISHSYNYDASFIFNAL